MTPQRLRAYVQIVVRDALIPCGGLALAFYLAQTHQFAWWQLPILAGMMMVPLVGREGQPDPEPRPDRRPEIEDE
jgi:hypothetical protein